ncbi:MAG: alanine racemase [Candidatus Lokiarchaeota archaeon]|nr:alanine racemase [Candidatus Lokiarchaeota archaeon]
MILTSTYEELKNLVKNQKFPLVICDLDAFNQNLERVGKHLKESKKSLRLCTKSIRVPELVNRVEKEDFVNGIFTYNSAEALFYAENYKTKDILLGYPTMSKVDVEELCQAAKIEGVTITVMVDDTTQIDLLESIAAKNNVELSTLIEVDVADTLLGRNVGVYRSPIRKPEVVVNLTHIISKKTHLRFRGIMGYEAQNASIGDDKILFRYAKKRSRKRVNLLRQNIVDALINAGFPPEVVNGGGSGCYQETAAEPSITEIGIGSLLFKSHIFDAINSLDDYIPSLFFVLQIVRKPRENIATAFSGGYISSGSVRALPLPVIPENLKLSKDEGFGEVQTPFIFNSEESRVSLGDPIFCRFSKAGEPLEHFNEINVYTKGEFIDKYKTYRGFGKRFS